MAVSSSILLAQDDELTIDDLYIDLSQRQVTAFSMLDIDDDAIQRPSSMNELAAQWSNFPFGDGSNPLAVEVNPYRLFANRRDLTSNIANYRKYFWIQNFTVAMAGTPLDDGSGKVAGSINWTPIDRTNILKDDDMDDIINTFLSETTDDLTVISSKHQRFAKKQLGDVLPKLYENKKLDSVFLAMNLNILTIKDDDERIQDENEWVKTRVQTIERTLTGSGIERAMLNNKRVELESVLWKLVKSFNNAIEAFESANKAADEFIKTDIETRMKLFRDTRWNSTVLQISAGTMWNSPDQDWNSMTLNTIPVIISLAYPTFHCHDASFSARGQLIWQVKNTFDAVGDTNRFSLGIRHLYGNHKSRWSIDILYRNMAVTTGTNEISGKFTTGVELKIVDKVWLEFAVGTTYSDQNGWAPTGAGNLKIDIYEKPRFTTSGG